MRTDLAPEESQNVRALVLRVEAEKGANRTLWLLTANQGLIRAVAYGSGKTNSPLAGATQQFCYSDFTLLSRRGFPRVTDAAIVDSFRELTEDFLCFSLACYFSELLCDLAPTGLDSTEALKCMLAAVYALARQKRDPELVRAAFTFRLLCECGFEPSLDGSGNRFSPSDGCIGTAGVLLTAGAAQALRHAASAPFSKLFSFTLGADSRAAFVFCTEQYVHYCTERGYATLDYYKKLLESEKALP